MSYEKISADLMCFAPHPDDIAFSVDGFLRYIKNQLQLKICLVDIFSRSCFYFDQEYSTNKIDIISRIRASEEVEYCRNNQYEILFLDYADSSARKVRDYFTSNIDRTIVTRLSTELDQILFAVKPSILLRPISIGSHVDHVIVDKALSKVSFKPHIELFYEDLPYAGEIDSKCIVTIIKNRLGNNITSIKYVMSSQEWASKESSFSYFKSQITEDIIVTCRTYAKSLWNGSGYCERLWRVLDE